jgi:hypothetical protein
MQSPTVEPGFTRLDIAPLSLNGCFSGQRRKTPDYKVWRMATQMLLPRRLTLPTGKFEVHFVFYCTNATDIDNLVKTILDSLQLKYKFNDSIVHRIIIDKIVAKKADHRIEFEIIPHTPISDFYTALKLGWRAIKKAV